MSVTIGLQFMATVSKPRYVDTQDLTMVPVATKSLRLGAFDSAACCADIDWMTSNFFSGWGKGEPTIPSHTYLLNAQEILGDSLGDTMVCVNRMRSVSIRPTSVLTRAKVTSIRRVALLFLG